MAAKVVIKFAAPSYKQIASEFYPVIDFGSAKPIQIVTPKDYAFRLEIDDFKHILEADNIKDRHVVVVSIAGHFRTGKSFILNFFLRYLYAQYKKHDVSDWIGKNACHSQLTGFKWRSGCKPETAGIWMWSEIFTHDFDNGEKVAIVLLDTQGILDSKISVLECTTTFALSMMLSSVQCYNIMQNIEEDDLQYLELFTEYARLAQQEAKKKSQKNFQNLIFVVRDWQYGFETGYGWKENEILTENEEKTPDIRNLMNHMTSIFNKISVFLMPYPGLAVAQGGQFSNQLDQIDLDFVEYVNEFVPAIFAPENLLVKEINGHKLRAGDLVPYLQAYINVFNGKSLPAPESVLETTKEVTNRIFMGGSLKNAEHLKQIQKPLYSGFSMVQKIGVATIIGAIILFIWFYFHQHKLI